MARLAKIHKEKQRWNLIQRLAKKRDELKAVMSDDTKDDDERFAAEKRFHAMPRNSSRSRHTRRCQSCGRPHAVYRRFGLCRLCIRKAISEGIIPGLKKASW